MIIEQKLQAWIQAGLALYRANPLMIESVLFDASQIGTPIFAGPTTVVDLEKYWLPDEYAGGMFRWGGQEFGIVSNTTQQLTLDGNASLVDPLTTTYYQIVPPAIKGLTELLQKKISVSSTFNQVPTEMPMITIRLEKDAQADVYIGESLKSSASNGVEFDIRQQAITGSYLLSVWAVNREAVLWMYAWLMTYALVSMPLFTSWGLYDVAFSGSDLDPAMQYLAERTYVRHFLLTVTRIERAVTTQQPIEWVSGLSLEILAYYQRFALTIPAME